MRQSRHGLAALCAMLLSLSALSARAENEAAGVFDYYVMALSWSPNWCALEGDARGDDQCDARHAHTFTLHGLWPQFETGWPSYCRTGQRDPSRSESAAMADIMGGAGLAWHQWKKHGRCTGLSAADTYTLMRRAYESVTIPPVFARVTDDLTLPASVVEEAFLESNSRLSPTMLTVTCSGDFIQEVRICLTKDFQPRVCGADVTRDCTLTDARMNAVR